MLRELRIENLLLIERAELVLEPGLNVITGETGAGKTVLAHSLDLLMGGKARKGIVRPGAGEAWVEGVFDLPPGLGEDPELADLVERLPSDAEELVLGRRVSEGGRTSAFVAGRAATSADLKALAPHLLAFYGQHEHRRLTISSAQMAILDASGGEAQAELAESYRAAYRHRQALARELAEAQGSDGARERDLDLHRFELGEIEAVAPTVEEEAGLAEERSLLRNSESLRAAAAGAADGLGGGEALEAGAATVAAGAVEGLEQVRGVDPRLDELAARLRAASLELEDVTVELRSYLAGVDSDPARLAAVEERLDLIDRLKRKHGGSVAAVLAHAERCRAEIARLEGGESRQKELADALERAGEELAEAGRSLSSARAAAAERLEREVSRELADLAMAGASLRVELKGHPEGHGPGGAESVEFSLSTNPGMEPAPLRDAASGGELSRVMLALTSVAGPDPQVALVFDEIDAGIGGNTATLVGEKLKRAGAGGQVVAITHLPQVASQAGAHFRVVKDAGADPATARVDRVRGEQLVEEIARMMGAGTGDEAAARHARELVAAGS